MILIALGSNLGSAAGAPAQTIAAALAALRANEIEPVRVSRFYCSEAWPDPADPPFVNAVAQITTELSPAMLLGRLHSIERQFGRE
ncbi:MAG TPA: 2-amino-4-hydroxy-6-hydroxymethyldihydropteridine diphosphokinase, partial [Terriglobales bacterium]